MASSKVLEKAGNEFTRKQNQEQSLGYCNYIKTNLVHVCKLVGETEDETKSLISNVSSMKGIKMSFKEKWEFRKAKDKAEKNLKYLYLTRDFFTALLKSASGLTLTNEEQLLVVKFAPFFDDVPVLDIDDSLLGAFKEVGQELKEAQHILISMSTCTVITRR